MTRRVMERIEYGMSHRDYLRTCKHAEEIIRLSQIRSQAAIDEIGKRLKSVKATIGFGFWAPWLRYKLGWDTKRADRYIDIRDGKATMPEGLTD